MTPRQHCIACLGQTPARPLDAALWVAMEHDAKLPWQNAMNALDQLQHELIRHLPALAPREQAQPLLRFMVDQGFQQDDPCHPRPQAALMHEVIERRRGQPLGLALIALDMASRLGIPLEGVSFPGHFLLRVPGADHLLDPCGGRRLYPKDCQELLARQFGTHVQLTAGHLRTATPTAMLQRLSRNLRHLHQLNDLHLAALVDATRVIELGDARREDYLARAELYRMLDCPQAERFDLHQALLRSEELAQRVDLERRLRELPKAPALH